MLTNLKNRANNINQREEERQLFAKDNFLTLEKWFLLRKEPFFYTLKKNKKKEEKEKKKMKGIVTGVVSRNKEDGKVSSMVYLSQIGFNAYEQSADVAKGYKTCEIYYGAKVDCEPGDLVNVEYEPGFQGRATVSAITVVKKKG